MIDLDSVMEEYESGYAKAYKNLPDLVAELKAARKMVEAARVYFKQRHLECERICDVHPECDHCHLCEDDMVELSQTRSEIEVLLKELGGEK